MRPACVPPVCSAFIFGVLSLPAGAVPGQGTVTAPAARTALLAAGTPVRVRLETPLRAGQCKVGDPVAFTVAQDVWGLGGARLLAQGAAGVGHVIDSAGHHRFGQPGRLAFTCDAVFGGDGGVRIPLRPTVRPAPPAGAPPASPAPADVQPLNDLHTPSPVAGDLLAGTPLGAHGQANRSISGTFTLGVGPDAAADAGSEFDAAVAADTLVPVLPTPPGVVPPPPPGAGYTLTRKLNGILVLSPPGAVTAPSTK